jgi:hypothetical protein
LWRSSLGIFRRVGSWRRSSVVSRVPIWWRLTAIIVTIWRILGVLLRATVVIVATSLIWWRVRRTSGIRLPWGRREIARRMSLLASRRRVAIYSIGRCISRIWWITTA